MNKMSLLKFFFAGIIVAMIVVTIRTSLQVSLFDVLPRLVRDPWTLATFTDFYFNILIITSWVLYREQRWLMTFVWFVAFVALGSIATASYVLLQLFRLRPGEPLSNALVRRR